MPFPCLLHVVSCHIQNCCQFAGRTWQPWSTGQRPWTLQTGVPAEGPSRGPSCNQSCDPACMVISTKLQCRKDMAALEHRAATLDLAEGCARCGAPVGELPAATAGISGGSVPQFYLFPSGNAFHGTCLASEVMQLVPAAQQQRIRALLTRLSQVSVAFCC